MTSDNRYILATVPSNIVPDNIKQMHLGDLEWTSFQTRHGREYEEYPSSNYAILDQTPLNELVIMTDADETKNTYKCSQLICKNIIVRTGKYRQFRNIRTFASCLETFSCLVMM